MAELILFLPDASDPAFAGRAFLLEQRAQTEWPVPAESEEADPAPQPEEGPPALAEARRGIGCIGSVAYEPCEIAKERDGDVSPDWSLTVAGCLWAPDALRRRHDAQALPGNPTLSRASWKMEWRLLEPLR